MGLTATIDLTGRAVVVTPTPAADLDRFLGGRGLGLKLLWQHVHGPLDPFGPANPLIFTVGPFTGTVWPAGARGQVTFHSPLTDVYGYANSGGHFWAALAHCGFDALVIVGQAAEPVYLDVTPAAVAIIPAPELWGLTTAELHDRLAVDRTTRIACIGPAGENGVRIAGIINDRSRAAARAGGGAVMGSKRLKAVIVHDARPAPAPRAFVAVAGAMARKTHKHPESQALHRWGTPLLIRGKNMAGDLPAYNHQAGQVPFYARIDAEAIDRYVTRHKSCHACPIGCDHETRVAEGPYATELGGPEYETVDALGPMLGLADIEAIIYANRLCNDLGLDTISTGVCIAFAMELRQRGLYTDPQFSLEWGDPASVLGLIRAIAHRQGTGDLLADGVKRAAEKLGPETQPYALHVKGMELPRQEPRIAKAFGLGHMTSNRGADHLYALPTVDIASNWEAARALFPAEMLPQLMDLADETYKADLVVYSENYSAVSDALGICKFATTETFALMPEDAAAGLSALRDRPITAAELLQAGERIVNLERLYNARLGLTRSDDRLPDRFTREPLPIYAFARDEATGAVQQSAQPIHVGLVRDPQAMLDRYYRLRGWNAQGLPTAEKLRELGLTSYAAPQPTGDGA